MPPLPWTPISTVEPGTELTVMASRLPLHAHRHIPGFLRWTLRTRRQLARSHGLVGYSLDAHLLAKTFWTVSAWTGQAEIGAFVRQEPHASGMAAIKPHMGEPSFVFWTVRADELPVRWKEVRQRVEAARASGGQGADGGC